MTKKILFLIFSLFFYSNNLFADGFCEESNPNESSSGVITMTGAESSHADCSFAPDSYQVVIYELGLCNGNPTAPTTSTAYTTTNCTMVINSPSGQTVDLAAGSEAALSDFSRPADGTYTHGYLLIKNTFGIKVTKQFSSTMHQFNTSNNGKFCWTLSGSLKNSEYDSWSNPTTYVNCGDEADAAPALYTETLDRFGASTYNYGPVNVSGGSILAYLVADSDDKLVTADAAADRLFGIQTFTNAIVVDSDSKDFTISFGVNQASSLIYTDEGNSNQYEVYAFGSGPFSCTMTVN